MAIFAPDFVYLQMQKTGSTFVERRILDGVAGAHRKGKHEPLRPSQVAAIGDRPVLATIRHPLRWYVSLWGFARKGNGEIFDRTGGWALRHAVSLLVRHRQWSLGGIVREVARDRAQWTRLYESEEEVASFRAWYAALHDLPGRRAWSDALWGVPLDPARGLYSHWVQRTLSALSRSRPVGSELLVDHFLRLEHLVDDARALSTRIPSLSGLDLGVLHGRNASSHAAPSSYWTRDLAGIALERDSWVLGLGHYREDLTDTTRAS